MDKLKVIQGGLEKLEKDTFSAFKNEDAEKFTELFTQLSKRSRQTPEISIVQNIKPT